jgi:hypothetical protein
VLGLIVVVGVCVGLLIVWVFSQLPGYISIPLIFWLGCGAACSAILADKPGGDSGIGWALGLLLGPLGIVIALILGYIGKKIDGVAEKSRWRE